MKLNIGKDLKEAIKKNKIIFFIGSGFSSCFKFPDWNQLIIDIVNELGDDKITWIADGVKVGNLPPIKALSFLTEYEPKIRAYIKENFKMDDERKKKLDNHKRVWEITNKIITTNYDKALEDANEESYLLKLHGSVANASKCVLFEEDYKKLYDNENERCVISQLKNITVNYTIIFLGFSLKDPYVCEIFENIHKIYKGYNNPHYIVIRGDEDFKKYGTKTIEIDSWNELPSVLDAFLECKNEKADEVSTDIETKIISTKGKTESIAKIAVLISNPIGKCMVERNASEISGCFNRVEAEIDFYNLSIDRLQELDDYDYIILFCKSSKDQLYIEGDSFEEVSVTINDIVENIDSSNIKGIYFFTDSRMETSNVDTDIPIIIIEESRKLKDDVFQIFRKKDCSKFLKSNCQLININETKLYKFSPKPANINITKISLPKQIDVKNLNFFVGRNDDLKTIITNIFKTKIDRRIFTVKGSGGIGKTTVVKKAAYEFSKRGFFGDGIYFIDCEHIESIKHLEIEVSYCFNIDNAINIEEHITSNELKKDKLIIFDNFEFLLNIDDKESIKDIRSLVKFLSEYSSIVLISREVIFADKCIEYVHELPDFSSDEAMELFKQNYRELDEEEEKILKEDILEKILFNNPLAIKIVKKNSEYKSMAFLKKELEEDFFNSVSCNCDIYNGELEDEKSRSLYNSINYSYKKLSDKEKLALEFLYLFPDGMNIEKFNEFSSGKFNAITITEIKMLDSKSLVEINSGNVKLLPIIRKFSKMKFQEREMKIKKRFYREVYNYNKCIIEGLDKLVKKNLRLFYENIEKQSNNILEFIDNLEYVAVNNEEKILNIYKLRDSFIFVGRGREYISKLESLQSRELNCKDSKFIMLLNVLKLSLKYLGGEFDNAYNDFTNIISINDILKLNFNDELDRAIAETSMTFYLNEGDASEALKISYKLNDENKYFSNLAYFYLGDLKKYIRKTNSDNFFHFEYDFALNKINKTELDLYINSIYSKQYLEHMECNYLKAKMGVLCKDEIEKLVIINPYTKGLKLLMRALLTDDENICNLYENAIENLRHIKYYYAEAIYYYSKYLKNIGGDSYDRWFELGYNSAKKYKFKYIIHLFTCLRVGRDMEYDENKVLIEE